MKLQHDVQIDIITEWKNYTDKNSIYPLEQKDDLLEKDLCYFDRIYEVKPTWRQKLFYKLKRKTKDQGQFTVEVQNLVNSQPTNIRDSIKKEIRLLVHDIHQDIIAIEMIRKLKHIDLKEYDVVISSFGPIWTHIVGSYIKKRVPDIKWLIDFRDPYERDADTHLSARRHARRTQHVCKNASALICAENYLKVSVSKRIPRYVITNGYDIEEANPPLKPKHFDLVFTGTLYGNRSDLSPVFRCVKELVDENKMDRADISIIYAGPNSEKAYHFAKRFDAVDFLDNLGKIPRKEAMHLQQTAAILIQLGWSTKQENPLWTGKMFEYMMARKPIIYLMTGDAPYSRVSKEIPKLGGISYEACRDTECYQPLKEYILEKYKEWRRTGDVSVQRDEQYVDQYSYANIAEQVWNQIC
jgi:hypothetical protein